MSDRRHRSTAPALPDGYQFGDAAPRVNAYVGEQVVGSFPYRQTLVTFRLGVDVCQTCGTKGTYDCPDCGIWRPRGVSQEIWRKRWRAPHENAAAQLKRREMVDGATLAPGDRPFITIGPDCQRIGDETT